MKSFLEIRTILKSVKDQKQDRRTVEELGKENIEMCGCRRNPDEKIVSKIINSKTSFSFQVIQYIDLVLN